MEIVNRKVSICKSGRICDHITIEQNPDNGLWRYRRRNIGVNKVSNVNWNSDVEAANAAAKIVASEQGESKLDLQGALRAQMKAQWQTEGIQAFRRGEPWRCWNNYQVQGYRAAKAESERIAVIGWPTPVKIEVDA